MFGMDDNEMEKMLATHPLTIFSKLVAEEPNNKVYQQCLEGEIHNAAESLAEHVGIEQLEFIEHVLSAIPDCDIRTENEELNEVFMNASIIKRIIAEVKRIKNK